MELGHDGVFHAMAARRQGEERVWERKKGAGFERAHRELVGWLRPDDVLVAHNLHQFDRPAIAERASDSPLLGLPTIDTLELSVLAFPRRPYHRLVKDDKLRPKRRPTDLACWKERRSSSCPWPRVTGVTWRRGWEGDRPGNSSG